MTDRALVLAAFDDLLPQLVITEEGLDGEANTIGAVEIACNIVAAVKAETSDHATLEDAMLYRLACLTGDLLTPCMKFLSGSAADSA